MHASECSLRRDQRHRLQEPFLLDKTQGSLEGADRLLQVFVGMRRREPPVIEWQIDAVQDQSAPEAMISLLVRMLHEEAVIQP